MLFKVKKYLQKLEGEQQLTNNVISKCLLNKFIRIYENNH